MKKVFEFLFGNNISGSYSIGEVGNSIISDNELYEKFLEEMEKQAKDPHYEFKLKVKDQMITFKHLEEV